MRKNRKQKMFMILFCIAVAALELGGCNYKDAEDNLKSSIADKATDANSENVQTDDVTCIQPGDDGKTVIEMGPEESLYGAYHVEYTFNSAMFYSSVEDTGIKEEDLTTPTFSCAEAPETGNWEAKEGCGFVILDITVNNIDSPGDESDGSIIIDQFMLEDKSLLGLGLEFSEDSDDMKAFDEGTSSCSYFAQHPVGEQATETNYSYLFISPGESKDIQIGFYLPTNDREKASKYVITYGTNDYIEIPWED